MKQKTWHWDDTIYFVIFIILMTLSAITVWGEASPAPLELTRLKGPVTLDGYSNEAAWADIPAYGMTGMIPNAGKNPSERTELFLGYDNGYIYIAGRLYDSEPDKIQVNSKKRDSGDPSSEWFGITIDSFNDKENGLAFFTTPAGLRWDATVLEDGTSLNVDWNAHWDVATARDDKGWYVEMRIPFSTLRFQDKEGLVKMGVISWRYIARHVEWDVFPAIPPKWGTGSRWKVSRAQEVTMKGIKNRKPIYVTPYLLGGLTQNYNLDAGATAYERNEKRPFEAGLDIKYSVSNNLTLDLSVNTDFAQVEADDQVLNLSRFSMYFPEKRAFFQERSSNFEFNFGSSSRMFYSRRIGLYDGQALHIPGGVRLVGRMGQWDIGVLDMQTARKGDHPSENFGIFRLRRQVFNPNSYIGGIVTSRIGADGKVNLGYGLDGLFRLFGNDYLTLKWGQTFETGKSNDPFSMAPARYRVQWDRRTNKGFKYSFSHNWSGEDFNPGVGYQLRHNFSSARVMLGYGWLPGASSFLFSHQTYTNVYAIWGNSDKEVETARFSPAWEFRSKSGFTWRINPYATYEKVREEFELGDGAVVPAGEYSFVNVSGEFSTPTGNRFYAAAEVDAGSFFDGARISVSLSPTWCLSPVWELSGTYRYDRIRFNGRSQRLDNHLARLRVLFTPSVKISGAAFIQYNSGADVVIANVRLRYNPREGNDFYLVFNEDFNTDRYGKTPHLPASGGRSVMLKYTYTFSI